MEGWRKRRDDVGSQDEDTGIEFADCAKERFDGDDCREDFEVKGVRPVIHWDGFNGAGGVGCVWDDYYT